MQCPYAQLPAYSWLFCLVFSLLSLLSTVLFDDSFLLSFCSDMSGIALVTVGMWWKQCLICVRVRVQFHQQNIPQRLLSLRKISSVNPGVDAGACSGLDA